VQWGRVSARAADAICVSGNHRRDWDPNRVHAEPLVQHARPGAAVQVVLVVNNPLAKPERLTVRLEGRGVFADQNVRVEVPARGAARPKVSFRLPAKIAAGRHVFGVRVSSPEGADGADAFLVVDVRR
jgi:hypothetical protein